jgi:hypothetical protein
VRPARPLSVKEAELRKQAWVGRVLRAFAVGLLVLPFLGILAQTAEAHHTDIGTAASCVQADGTWDFTYTVTAGTSMGTAPEDLQNPSVQVWFVWDGPTPTSNTPPDFSSIGAVLNQTGAFVWNGDPSVYPSFGGSGAVPAGVSKVTVWAVPTAPWSDGTPAEGSARWAEVTNLGPCSIPASASVSMGECTWNGESSLTPVTVVIAPDSGATLTIDGPGGPYVFTGTGGSIDLSPGDYSWSATAASGYQLTGDTSGKFSIGSCAPPTTTTTRPTTTTTRRTTTTTQPTTTSTTLPTTTTTQVLGTTVTRETTPSTLPFTGSSSGGVGGAGIALVLLGGLLLLASRREEERRVGDRPGR